jgi:hypothetical protein
MAVEIVSSAAGPAVFQFPRPDQGPYQVTLLVPHQFGEDFDHKSARLIRKREADTLASEFE